MLDRVSMIFPQLYHFEGVKAMKKPLEQCQKCGGPIYPKENVYVIDGYIFHFHLGCLLSYIDPKIMSVEEALRLGE